MENLKGKRLLLLGGDFWTEEQAQYAAETGVKLIATAKKAPSKLFEIAEESYTVDPTDAEGMKKLIREKKSIVPYSTAVCIVPYSTARLALLRHARTMRRPPRENCVQGIV